MRSITSRPGLNPYRRDPDPGNGRRAGLGSTLGIFVARDTSGNLRHRFMLKGPSQVTDVRIAERTSYPKKTTCMEEKDVEKISNNLTSRLFESRTIIISGEINQRRASSVIAQLIGMAASSDDDITMFINSQGGHVESGDTIHDMIRFIRPRVRIIGTGWVASAGALIFVSVPVTDRFCLPNTRFLLHQPAGGAGGTASDIEIEAEEIIKMRHRLNQIFARQTTQPLARIEKDTNRNFWLTAEDAKVYGLVGHIVETIDDVLKVK
ncbi:MAG: ATP-dependent Clp protease proteolytic subunit [Rhodothermales bacterium]|nr:ATP-dependent Clp protease proteolytic subunit [Rhodothermales bacterium]